jgi:protein TonB
MRRGDERTARRAGTGLTLALHAAALCLLFLYRPAFPAEDRAESPLQVLLEPVPPPVEVRVTTPPTRSRAAAPAPTHRALRPGGGGKSEALDLTPTPLPTFSVPVSVPVPTAGTGSGQGDGSGSGSDTGAGDGAGASGGGSVRDADWIVKPEDKMPKFNPWRARAKGVSGDVLLHCQVAPDSTARNCRIVHESPGGYGFGEAALKVSRYFRLSPPMVNGAPRYEIWVPIPIAWFNVRAKTKPAGTA